MSTPSVVAGLVVAVLACVAAVAIVVLVRGSLRWRRGVGERWAELARWARDAGWSLRRGLLVDVDTGFRGWPFNRDWGFRLGETLLVVEGWHGDRPAVVFEYVHTQVTRGRSMVGPKTHYRIAAVTLPVTGPGLEVKRRRRGGTPVELGPEVDELPLDERFAATFAIWTDDNGFASYVLTPELKGWLLSAPESAPLSFRFEGDRLLCWQRGTVDAEWVVTAVGYLEAVLGRARPVGSYGGIS